MVIELPCLQCNQIHFSSSELYHHHSIFLFLYNISLPQLLIDFLLLFYSYLSMSFCDFIFSTFYLVPMSISLQMPIQTSFSHAVCYPSYILLILTCVLLFPSLYVFLSLWLFLYVNVIKKYSSIVHWESYSCYNICSWEATHFKISHILEPFSGTCFSFFVILPLCIWVEFVDSWIMKYLNLVSETLPT